MGIDRLRAAAATLPHPNNLWNSIPVSRRAGVLAILYPEPPDDVGCLLTTRAQSLSYAGDAALPGGKADSELETPWDVAIREAREEIGVDISTLGLENMATLPAYLSSRTLAVVPSVAWLPSWSRKDHHTGVPTCLLGPKSPEVAQVFGVRLGSLLNPAMTRYRSERVNWNGLRFNQHFFQVLARDKRVGEPGYHVVWGLTANILLDIARLTFGRDPSFPHRRPGQFGDQQLVEALAEPGNPLQNPRVGKRGPNFRRLFGSSSPLLATRSPERNSASA